MHLPINVKSPNNTSKWQMGFNSVFEGLISSGPKKKEHRYTSLRETKASNSQRMWAEFSSFTPKRIINFMSNFNNLREPMEVVI
jgi:hypothetical protein